MAVGLEVVDPDGALCEGQADTVYFAGEAELASGPQRLKDLVEIGIISRFMQGERLLDVGIGTGRVSLPLASSGVRLTGIDASAAMIERCASDPRAATVRLVQGNLERLPFAAETFDTVISVDTLVHFEDWQTMLDEMVRVTQFGGRTIVDLGSRDHLDAVTVSRRLSHEAAAATSGAFQSSVVRLRTTELRAYAAERNITLVALVPYGAVLGGCVPNAWTSESYAATSGGIERLVSWLGADPALFAFAEFIERRIVQHSPPSISGRMFAVFERRPDAAAYREPRLVDIAACDERGSAIWHAEFAAHLEHEPNRGFALSFLLAGRADRLPPPVRAQLPQLLLHELERAECAARDGEACAGLGDAWRSAGDDLRFHGVDLAPVFARALQRELRARSETNS